ncbi:MAG: CobW family GTP-binding protein [Mycobacterium sp.]
MSEPIPVTVIAGALGSGKTTLVNHVLRESVGRRIAVLVNDFGELDIDAAVIESADAATISLRNGCICCSLGGGLTEGLAALRTLGSRPDQILVEASGVSLPRGLLGAVGGPGLRLDGILVVVDAVDITQRARDRYVGDTVREQIASADLLVLNKVDEATATELDAARTLLSTDAPEVPVLETAYGTAPLSVLLGPLDPHRRPAPPHANDYGHTELDTASFQSDHPIDAEVLGHWLTHIPRGVLRAKGLVRLAGDSSSVRLVQVVGTRKRLTRVDPSVAIPGVRMVVIGTPSSFTDEIFAPLATPRPQDTKSGQGSL